MGMSSIVSPLLIGRCYTTVLCWMDFERELCIELRVLVDASLHFVTTTVAAVLVRIETLSKHHISRCPPDVK